MVKKRNTLQFPDTFKVISLIESPKQYDVEELIKVIGNKILGYTTANIIIQHNDKILDKFSTEDCELQALLDKTIVPHTYNLLIRQDLKENLETVICHEMCHFDQYERGDLNIVKEGSNIEFSYKNIIYPANTPY